MPEVNNIDIGIEMDGKRLREYDTQINGVTAKSWIESEAGKVLNPTVAENTEDTDTYLRNSLSRPRLMPESTQERRSGSKSIWTDASSAPLARRKTELAQNSCIHVQWLERI